MDLLELFTWAEKGGSLGVYGLLYMAWRASLLLQRLELKQRHLEAEILRVERKGDRYYGVVKAQEA